MAEDNDDMTVREAGEKGGERVRELVEEGKQHENETGNSESFRENLDDPEDENL